MILVFRRNHKNNWAVTLNLDQPFWKPIPMRKQFIDILQMQQILIDI